MGEDGPHQGHLANRRGRSALRPPRPWARTTRTEVTSPMGEDNPLRGHLADGRGPTSCPDTMHPRLSSLPTATATRPSEPRLFGRCRNQRHKPCSREEKHLGRQAWPRGSQTKTPLLTPHHDALVISLTVANCLVKRILVDNGSSGNIIFQAAYKDLGLEEGVLTRRITPLIVPTATATRPSEPRLFGRCRNQRHKPCSREEKHLGRQAWPRGSQTKTPLLTPHHDALVISLTVANCLVKRILVDNGSSGNIIFQAAYKDLGLEEGVLTRRITPLIGFSGEVKQTVGESKPPARHTEEPVVEEIDEVPLTERDQTRHLQIGSKLTKGLRRRLIDFLRSNSVSGIEFLQTQVKTPASGSPLERTPVPRIPARRSPGSPLWSFQGSVSG
ncbi:hypothetical protein F2Q69_00031249 [Brassica cretica]|uniref:Uncharacterized protein n=1 Tax=Brassica cretica TaxID=69181 RepID=A0A8S9RZW6_BRACR|nr:hypothetical protein F2Q69_00031249 [Brassica cretica]